MNKNLVSAIFNHQDDAKIAVENLVESGVPRSAISYAGREDNGDGTQLIPNGDDNVDAPDVVRGVAMGGAFGALLSIAALAIPFVGPAVAAGAIGSAVVPGVALTGALVGGAIGGLQQGLIDHGFNERDAKYYGEHLEKGGILIAVDLDASTSNAEAIEQILHDAGGHRPATSDSELAG